MESWLLAEKHKVFPGLLDYKKLWSLLRKIKQKKAVEKKERKAHSATSSTIFRDSNLQTK